MIMARKNLKRFNPNAPPRLFHKKPEKMITSDIALETFEVTDGEFDLGDGTYLTFDTELDYKYCYYESDTPSVKIIAKKFSRNPIENPHYDSELEKYNKAKDKHKEAKAEWNKLKKLWNAEQAEKKREAELKLFQTLREKYENT